MSAKAFQETSREQVESLADQQRFEDLAIFLDREAKRYASSFSCRIAVRSNPCVL